MENKNTKEEIQKIMDKVRKLLEFNKKNNASEAEIETAAMLVRKITRF